MELVCTSVQLLIVKLHVLCHVVVLTVEEQDQVETVMVTCVISVVVVVLVQEIVTVVVHLDVITHVV